MCNTAPYPQSCLIAHRSAADLGKCPPVPIHTFLSNVVLEAPRVVNQGSCFHKPPALAVGLLTVTGLFSLLETIFRLKKGSASVCARNAVEAHTGIEPAMSEWKSEVLPLHHTNAPYAPTENHTAVQPYDRHRFEQNSAYNLNRRNDLDAADRTGMESSASGCDDCLAVVAELCAVKL